MQDILDKVAFLFEHYSLERRAITQPYLLQVAQRELKDYAYDPGSSLIRETLLEHVGSLPMLATAFFPYIDNPDVNLGEALIMLAIHDIGELTVHDEITFMKKADDNTMERQAAFALLDPLYYDFYDDVETKGSPSAKFAKAVDKINPDIFDYLTPAEITKRRYKHFLNIEPSEIVDTIVKHKRPHMLWNPFMTAFHSYLMEQLRKNWALSLWQLHGRSALFDRHAYSELGIMTPCPVW